MVPESLLSQKHMEYTRASRVGAMKGGITHGPNPAGTYPLDVVYDGAYDIPSQEQHRDNEEGTHYPAVAPPNFAPETSPNLHDPVRPILPHSMGENTPSFQQQTRAQCELDDRTMRGREAHDGESIARPSPSETTNPQYSCPEQDWTYDASPGASRDYGSEMIKYQRAPGQRYIHHDMHDIPVANVEESNTEDGYGEDEPTITPRKRSFLRSNPKERPSPQAHRHPGAGGKRHSESAPRGETRELDGTLQCNEDGHWSKHLVGL